LDPFLAIKNLSCSYNHTPVLKDISFNVDAGDVLVLIGPNGSGKTTLLRALCRIITPEKGGVFLNGEDIWRQPARKVAKIMAFVAQNTRIAWPFTVEQVINMGRFPHHGWMASLTEHDHLSVQEAMQLTGTTSLKDRTIGKLSGGEFQRTMIARALAQEPQILMLDEPIAHLDIRYKVAILNLIKDLAGKGITVILSMHDLNLAAQYADNLALLHRGELKDMGNPKDILTHESLNEVYGAKLHVLTNPLNQKPWILTP
jgi:iron complex transport system ATP-binding protein